MGLRPARLRSAVPIASGSQEDWHPRPEEHSDAEMHSVAGSEREGAPDGAAPASEAAPDVAMADAQRPLSPPPEEGDHRESCDQASGRGSKTWSGFAEVVNTVLCPPGGAAAGAPAESDAEVPDPFECECDYDEDGDSVSESTHDAV